MAKKFSVRLSRNHSASAQHEWRMTLTIAVCWTFFDFLLFIFRAFAGMLAPKYLAPEINLTREILLREVNVFLVSLMIGYLLVSVLDNFLRNTSLWYALLVKTLILVFAAFFMNFCIYFSYEWLIAGHSSSEAMDGFLYNMFSTKWLFQKMPEWIFLFVFTQLALEVNKKYSRGVFFSIMIGKYLQPREENRIILFIDLRDSTPIAEKLGHREYFKFIRDFINNISAGMMPHDGRIYQYVGDEIVIWWPSTPANARKCIASLIQARKELNKNSEVFRRRYGIVPEYKAGVHTGMVTVGQVGIVRKDVVMSGDTINTTARIRSACTDLNQKLLASKEMVNLLGMQDWQAESMGSVELKGKYEGVELYALKI